jgi:hypothetical protein
VAVIEWTASNSPQPGTEIISSGLFMATSQLVNVVLLIVVDKGIADVTTKSDATTAICILTSVAFLGWLLMLLIPIELGTESPQAVFADQSLGDENVVSRTSNPFMAQPTISSETQRTPFTAEQYKSRDTLLFPGSYVSIDESI